MAGIISNMIYWK